MNAPLLTARADLIACLEAPKTYDLAIVGGGATGLGVALDAAARGLSVILVESHDFAKGTSSRATKLVHGGVRYLAQGNISLVREALHERGALLKNAPHLAQPLPFVMPSYKLWETPFYGVGLKMYDALAGKSGLGKTEFLDCKSAQRLLPTIASKGLKGGVKYWDGQFDDARLALTIARTAAAKGALLINYCAATGLMYDEQGRLSGIKVCDQETSLQYTIKAKCVVNAAGVWVDELRTMDGDHAGRKTTPMLAPSQGMHLVVDREFMPTDHALLVPKTADGRVLFAVPWLGKTILGTTDTPRHDLDREPTPFKDEIEFILNESAKYLKKAPTRADVKSVWVGLRPLVKPDDDESENTKSISREHTVRVSKSGLVTVTGGKWTTYRAMAEDVLEKCFDEKLLPRSAHGVTASMPLIGADVPKTALRPISESQGLHSWGSEAASVCSLPGKNNYINSSLKDAPGGALTEAMVRFAVRYEYARTVEDVLARRWRLLFIDANMAATIAPDVEKIVRDETGQDTGLKAFLALCQQYLTLPA